MIFFLYVINISSITFSYFPSSESPDSIVFSFFKKIKKQNLFKKRNICQSKEIKRKTRVWLSFIQAYSVRNCELVGSRQASTASTRLARVEIATYNADKLSWIDINTLCVCVCVMIFSPVNSLLQQVLFVPNSVSKNFKKNFI